MRCLLAGDTHGNGLQAQYISKMAYQNNADVIVQLGDWEYSYLGEDFANLAWRKLVPPEMWKPIYFLGGNHEDWPALDKYEAQSPEANRHPLPNIEGPPIWYLGRVSSWTWDEVRFLSVSGAYSVDQDSRTECIDWFPREKISEADIHKACDVGKVDILLSHDCPNTNALERRLANHPFTRILPQHHKDGSAASRKAIETILSYTQPSHMWHGHMHFRYEDMYEPTNTWVRGLSYHGKGTNSWYILDTNGTL